MYDHVWGPPSPLPSSQRKLGSLTAWYRSKDELLWVYIMTNRRGGVLYTGVTSDLPLRIEQINPEWNDLYERPA